MILKVKLKSLLISTKSYNKCFLHCVYIGLSNKVTKLDEKRSIKPNGCSKKVELKVANDVGKGRWGVTGDDGGN